MPFSGSEVSEKGFPSGWEARENDEAAQRVFRITRLLEAMVFRPFSWDRFNSLRLKYAFHGGYIDAGDKWLLIPDGVVTLVSGSQPNFIQRSDAGQVTVNQTGFIYPEFIPMAQVNARNGKIVENTYIDRRPEIGGAPVGGGGAISFEQIIGQISNSQVPLSAVQQYQLQLCNLADNIVPGVFGSNPSCNAALTESDYVFPRDLDIVQDLFVGRDAIINEDLQVIETLMVGGTFTAESLSFFLGAAVFEALATFQAAVVMESTLNVQALATFEAQTLFQALATFQAAAVFESTVNVEGLFTAEAASIFVALATFQAAVVMESTLNVQGVLTAEAQAIFEASALFLDRINVEGISTLEDQVRRGIRTITAADTPYTLVETDWHLNVDISLGSVEVLIPDAAAHFAGGFTDQLHFKIIGSGFMEPFVTLTPSVPGQLIDGFEEAILRRNNLSFTLVTDGIGWWIQ
jgi:hypothetical protein